MKQQSVFVPVPVEENKPATNPATNNGITERSDEVIFYDETLGWNVGWRKLFTSNSIDPLFPDQVKGYSIFENLGGKFRHVTHYLEKKEDVFVMTKEELEKVYKAVEDSKENEINGDGETDFNDWLNTQKP